ncbi:hypothetical protein ACFL3V_05705 [Nanoarchaeota archaeon]
MIGPKKFTQKERDSIRDKADDLEKKIADLEIPALEACDRVIGHTQEYCAKVEGYLAETGLEKYLEVVCINKAFTPFTPDIRAPEADLHAVTNEVAKMLSSLVDDEQNDYLKALRIEYEAEVKAAISSTRRELSTLYRQLFDLTMIEQVLDVERAHENALVYVIYPDRKSLMRIKTDFKGDHPPEAVESNIVKEYAFTKGIQTEMKETGQKEDADVYLVHNPNARIDGDVMLRTAWDTLGRAYGNVEEGIDLSGTPIELREKVGKYLRKVRMNKSSEPDKPVELFSLDKDVLKEIKESPGYRFTIAERDNGGEEDE